MAIQTPEEYYENEENWGGYSFLKFKDFIDEILLETIEPDSLMANTRRITILRHAKEGLRVLNRSIKKTVLAIEMTVGPLLYFQVPQDYIDWVRVSVVLPDFKLKPLNINHKINISTGYLQDHNAEILFDDQGGILKSDSTNTFAHPHKRYEFCRTFRGNQPGLDTSELSEWGEFTIDERSGRIGFSSNLEDKEVVIEYISDGVQMQELSEEEITFHKDLKNALWHYVYYHCIRTRRNVRRYDKRDAMNAFLKVEHQLKIDSADFDINQMIRLLNKRSKQL
jgi:hypothetical protein